MSLHNEYPALYRQVHSWARKNIPKPLVCIRCNQEKKLELSNNSREYRLSGSDWEWICRLCHARKDNWSKGRVLTEEHKRKIGLANSIALKGKPTWNKGVTGYKTKPSSEEKKAKLRIANKGQIPWNKGKRGVQKYSEERMKNMREALRGKPSWNKGKTFTGKPSFATLKV